MPVARSIEVLGHPRGIFLIFSTEIWERFSYYGMRGLLVLFLSAATIDGGFGWTATRALEIYATYTALVYLVPILGGYIGDRWLGRKRSVMLGSALMMAGHFAMVVPGLSPMVIGWLSGFPVGEVLYQSGVVLGSLTTDAGHLEAMSAYADLHDLGALPSGAMILAYQLTSWSFYLALLLIILGTGFFKPNMATMVGELYSTNDPRRDAGYTIYYTGANIGAFLANLVAGTIGELFGWHYGFSAAGIGMGIGLILFSRGARRSLVNIGDRPKITAVTRKPLSHKERHRVAGVFLMSMFTIVFWMGFEQGGGLLSIMVRDSVERTVLGFDTPVTWFQSLNPMFIFLFAPLFVALWGSLSRRDIDLHPTTKYAIGLGLMAVSFGLLMLAQREIHQTGRCSPWWLVAVFAVQTAGELAISPVSKSLVSRFAPARVASPLMGAEFACYAVGAWMAGQVGAWALNTNPGDAFEFLLVASLFTAGLCLGLRRVVDRLLGVASHQSMDAKEVSKISRSSSIS